jgi:hypothetical protein
LGFFGDIFDGFIGLRGTVPFARKGTSAQKLKHYAKLA